jgi:hypothetical protein
MTWMEGLAEAPHGKYPELEPDNVAKPMIN